MGFQWILKYGLLNRLFVVMDLVFVVVVSKSVNCLHELTLIVVGLLSQLLNVN